MSRGRGVGRTISTVQTEIAVDLTAASVDVPLVPVSPSPGARVISWWFRTTTVGIGIGVHTLTLEAGAAGGGDRIASSLAVVSPGVDESFLEASGQDNLGAVAEAELDKPGAPLQIQNVESGAITTGVIGTVGIVWQI